MKRGACILCLVLSSLSAACARHEPPAASSCPPCASATPCPGGLVVSPAIPLDVPVPQAAAVPLMMQIDVFVNGDIHADGSKVDGGLAALLPIAQKAQAANPEVRATIRADKDVTHGRVIAVLDTLKQAGISKIAFGVSPASPAPSSTP